MRPAARASLSSSAARLEVGGSGLGISNTPVTPPSTAAREPVSRSSFQAMPGSRKCTWVSITPGSTTRPVASNTSAPDARAKSPIAQMRPARTPTSAGPRPAWFTTSPPRTIRSKVSDTGGGVFQQRLGGGEHAVGGEVDHVANLSAERRIDPANLVQRPRAAHDAHVVAPGPPDAVVRRTEKHERRRAGGGGELAEAGVVADEQPNVLERRIGGEQVRPAKVDGEVLRRDHAQRFGLWG